MRIKPDWTDYIHAVRKKEMEIIFSNCPRHFFDQGLELGAGDCYQSAILAGYVKHLTVTEYSKDWLQGKNDTESVKHTACDAELIDTYFENKRFDIVFSSSVLEHLPHLELALKGIHNILKDNGVAIHILPNPFWKLLHLLLFYPNLLIYAAERVFEKGYLKNKLKGLFMSGQKQQKTEAFTNNPKLQRKHRIFVPLPHGAFKSHTEELFAFRKTRWAREFTAAGFSIVKTLKGPVSSPYGFGCGGLRRLAERMGITFENIYIVSKTGCESAFVSQCLSVAVN